LRLGFPVFRFAPLRLLCAKISPPRHSTSSPKRLASDSASESLAVDSLDSRPIRSAEALGCAQSRNFFSQGIRRSPRRSIKQLQRCSRARRHIEKQLFCLQLNLESPYRIAVFCIFEDDCGEQRLITSQNAQKTRSLSAGPQQLGSPGRHTRFVKWKCCFFRPAVVIGVQCLRSP